MEKLHCAFERTVGQDYETITVQFPHCEQDTEKNLIEGMMEYLAREQHGEVVSVLQPPEWRHLMPVACNSAERIYYPGSFQFQTP